MMNRTRLAIFALVCATALTLPASSQQKLEDLPDAPVATIPNGALAVLDTSMGRITCQFYQRQAPLATSNFIRLTNGTQDWLDAATNKVQHGKPLYNGTTFHRVIPGFMIQGGDPSGSGLFSPGYDFKDEKDPNLNFDRPGRLAMANSGPNTNGSQFFVTEEAYPTLNQGYSLFGQCDDASIAVVKAITAVPRDSNDKPYSPVKLIKVTIVDVGQPLPPLQPGEPAAGSPATGTAAPIR